MWFLLTEESTLIIIKYFIIQAFRSGLLIWAFFFNLNNFIFVELIISLRFLIKLGAAPFHIWIINMIMGIKWPSILILTSLQKIIPLYGIYNFSSLILKFFSIIICLLVASLGSFNTQMLKVLIAYSSIFSLAWLLARENFLTITFYLIIYSLNLLGLISFLEFSNNLLTRDFQGQETLSKKVMVLLILLSIAGLPPIIGFLAKIYIVWELILLNNLLLLFVLIVFSLFILFLYLRIGLFSVFLSNPQFILSSYNFYKTEVFILNFTLLIFFLLLLSVLHKRIWFFKL